MQNVVYITYVLIIRDILSHSNTIFHIWQNKDNSLSKIKILKMKSAFVTFKIVGYVIYRRQNTFIRDIILWKRVPTDSE